MTQEIHRETMLLQRSREAFYHTLEGITLSSKIEEGGRTVQRDVKLGKFLGAGGMSGVVEGTYEGRKVAVKILDPDLAKKRAEGFRSRFVKEVKTVLELPPHENLLKAFFGGTDKGVDFLVTEYVEHIALGKGKDGDGKPFEIDYACEIIRKAGKGLSVGHQKFKAHRDIKPENIFADRTASVVKLADFGVIRDYGKTRQTAAGMDIIGTPSYMSPEQICNQANMYSDQYSLGATFYHMITGTPPFEGETIAATLNLILKEDPAEPQLINPAVPYEINDMILRTLAKDWRQRYITVAELVEEIEMLQNHTIPIPVLKKYVEQNEEQTEKETDFNKLFLKSFAETGHADLTKITVYGRKVVETCWKMEREELAEQLNSLKPSTETDVQADFVAVIERLLRITPRTRENVLERVSWLKTLRKLYSNLAEYNADVQAKKQSADNRLAWEINRRNYLGVAEPKTFLQKHGKKMRTGGLCAIVLMLVGAVGHITGTTIYHRNERNKTKQEISQLETEINEMLETSPIDCTEAEVRQKINLLRRLSQEDAKPAQLEKQLESRKEEAAVDRAYASAKSKISQAQKAIEESKDKNCTVEERINRLKKATDLITAVENTDLKQTKGAKEEELKTDLKQIAEDLGPMRVAFENFSRLETESEEIEKSYASLEQQLAKEEFFSKETLRILGEKNRIATYILMGIGNHFLDERYRPTPAFQKLADRIKQQETQIALLEKRLYTGQIEKARKNAGDIETIIAWQNGNRLSEEAAAKDEEAIRLRKQAETLFSNIDSSAGSIHAQEIAKLRGNIDSLFKEYAPVQEQISKLTDLRKKAKAGDITACTDLGKNFFLHGEYSQAQKYFQQILDTKDTKTIRTHQADTYLKTIALERILGDETKKIHIRENLAETELNKYHMLAEELLSARNLDSTELSITLRKLEKMPGLEEEITQNKAEITALLADANALRTAQKALDESPEDQELKKKYDSELSSYLNKAKEHKGLGIAEEKARAYLSSGTKEHDPEALYETAGCYEALQMNETASSYYEKYLELTAKHSLISARERKEIEVTIKELKK